MSGKYITDLQVSLNETEESQLRDAGFINTQVNLSKGNGKDRTLIWYKRGDSGPITRIEFSFTDAMSEALNNAGYLKIPKNISAGGDDVYLWFSRVSSEHHVPIVNLDVSITDEAQKFKFGWERLACDLNQESGGHWVFLWVKRGNPTDIPTYIHDITAIADFQGDTEKYKDGYIRLNVNTTRGAGGADVFIWYRETIKPLGAIKDLQVSINDTEAKEFQDQGYRRVNIDLNKGTGGNPVFLWYKKDDSSSNPIKAVTQVVTRAAVETYQAAGAEVIWKNLNAGVNGAPELYLCFHR